MRLKDWQFVVKLLLKYLIKNWTWIQHKSFIIYIFFCISPYYSISIAVQPIMETVKESEESGTGEVESNNSAERWIKTSRSGNRTQNIE